MLCVCVCVCVCVCARAHACVLSQVRLFATPWTVAHQAPLSMGFSRQEYWNGLPFPTPGDFPDPGIKPAVLVFPALVLGSSLPLSHLGSPLDYNILPGGPVVKTLHFHCRGCRGCGFDPLSENKDPMCHEAKINK